MAITLLSTNCGVPRTIGERHGQPVISAFGKSPVHAETIFFGTLGIEGDVQAHQSVHGGPDKAVCVYFAGHWPWWRAEQNLACKAATFGENLTVLGADEETVGIGDRFLWGGVVLEVTQPRGPCANVDLYHRREGLAQAMTLTARCGWYMRVILEGSAQSHDTTIEHARANERPSIKEALLARHDSHAPLALRRRVHDAPQLAPAWRRAIARTFA